jgi:hypothetical protein
MREQRTNTGAIVLRIAFALFAVLVLVNGIILLCESDPASFYATLFGLH